MSNKISILGCGWLGLPLAKKLIEKGHAVNGSVRTPEKLPQLKAKKINPFLINIADASKPLPELFFDAEKLVICIPEKNIKAHEYLMEQINQTEIKQIIYTSSTSVYKNINGTVNENSALRDVPLTHIEQVYLKGNTPALILRLSGLFGPDRHPGRFFRKRKDATLTQAPTNLIHQSQVLDTLFYFLEKEPRQNIFNVTSDEHPPKFDFYSQAFKDYFGEKPQFVLGKDKGGKVVSNEKLKKEMGSLFKLMYPFSVS